MYNVDWEKIKDVLEPRPQILAAWGFGSAQSGLIRPGSDLDIGILWADLPTLTMLADLRADLQAVLHFDDIDLITLNRASAVIRFAAVCGHIIFCRCPDKRVAFVSLTAREYEDSMAMVQRALADRTRALRQIAAAPIGSPDGAET